MERQDESPVRTATAMASLSIIHLVSGGGPLRRGSLIALLAAALSVGGTSQGWSQPSAEAVREAIAAGPGLRYCRGLAGGSVGIHLPNEVGTLYFPSEGPTAYAHHAFVLYAGPDDGSPPELVADLARRGVVRKVVVTATVDQESGGANGAWTRHEIKQFPFAIFMPRRDDDSFVYDELLSLRPPEYGRMSFPSRQYPDKPLPPADQHYLVPTITPYETSTVKSVCYPREVHVEDIREVGSWLGPLVQAVVTYVPRPLDWMLTPAFARAAVGYGQAGIDARIRSTVTLRHGDGDRLIFVEERAAP